MKPSKAYILYHDEKVSEQYAATCGSSCQKLDFEFEYFKGFSNIPANDAWNQVGLKRQINRRNIVNKAQLCSAGHAAIWKKIYDNKECAIIFEHDGMLLHKVDIDIPDEGIVVLGYKVTDPQNYDHEKAGPPKNILPIEGHEGAHAYAMTYKTAGKLIEEIEQKGVLTAVDNQFFLTQRKGKTNVPIYMMEPTPAIGWLRESTIWNKSSTRNYPFIESFASNYNKS